jgi:hypothetical protein
MTIPYLCTLKENSRFRSQRQEELSRVFQSPRRENTENSDESSGEIFKTSEINELVESVLEDLRGIPTPEQSDDTDIELCTIDPILIKSLGNEKKFSKILSKVKKNKKRLFITCLGIVVYKRLVHSSLTSSSHTSLICLEQKSLGG